MDESKDAEMNKVLAGEEILESGFGVEKANIQMDICPAQEKQSLLRRNCKIALICLIHIAVGSYFGYATHYYIREYNNHQCSEALERDPLYCSMRFCDGYGFLILFLGFIYFGLIYYKVFKPTLGHRLYRKYLVPLNRWWMIFSRKRSTSAILIGFLFVILAIFLYYETKDEPQKLSSLAAPCFFIACGNAFSTNRSAIKWRLVITGITCQFMLGIICIRWSVGRSIFECIGNRTANFLSFADEGSRFVYGDDMISQGVFAFAILSVIFFFSFLISILYYMGVMQWVVMKLGWLLAQLLGTTVCESVTAAANIVLSMTESAILIRPYIKLLTASEIHSIMVSGFATVSGSVLAAYLSFGASPAHLITSSVMAAPASLAISKLYLPETEESKNSANNIQLEKSQDSSLLDAASNGANNAIQIVLGVTANLIAFVAFIAFLNAVVSWFGGLVGLDYVDFEWLFSKLFIPLAWAMGVPWQDCDEVAKIVATKTIINEFVAYERLGILINNNAISARSAGIATFAICGFANPSSMGMMIGILATMAPKSRGVITSVAFRAFVVGSIVCFVSASFAGILMQEEEESRVYQKILSLNQLRNITIGVIEKQ